jgi:hypothetical protein
VTLEQATKKARICTNGCDEMSFAAAFKTTKNPNDFHEFSRQVKLAGEMISQVLSSLHTVSPFNFSFETLLEKQGMPNFV